jgi:GDP-mannose transporter
MADKKSDDNYVVPMPGQASSHRPVGQHNERPPPPASSLVNSPTASILGYCLASISMTVVNKYIVSGRLVSTVLSCYGTTVFYVLECCRMQHF